MNLNYLNNKSKFALLIKTMFRKFLVIGFIGLSLSSCKEQKTDDVKGNTESKEKSVEELVYEKAKNRGDVNSAIYAINVILEKDSSRLDLADTLAYLYYRAGNPESCSDVVNMVLSKKPDDVKLLELGGVSDQTIGNFLGAIDKFERIYAINKDLKYHYQAGTIMLNAGMFTELEKLVQEIIDDPNSAGAKVEIPNVQGKPQEVSLKAAAFNLKGYMYAAQNKKEPAVKAFRSALEYEKYFDLPAEGLNQILYGGK